MPSDKIIQAEGETGLLYGFLAILALNFIAFTYCCCKYLSEVAEEDAKAAAAAAIPPQPLARSQTPKAGEPQANSSTPKNPNTPKNPTSPKNPSDDNGQLKKQVSKAQSLKADQASFLSMQAEQDQ
eukprot:TRINITY_DN320_c0_g1_i11.p1 TRINITY_DN320_c0_g1~~TRINITY_DN320_c0_g1_i11.p1  ORF type:complete len:126 (-),score=14.48 TRINITY_DN320_c0_g1_i11:478-855(-)